MVRRYNGLEPLAAHVHLYKVVFKHIRIYIAKAYGALGGFIGYNGIKALALRNVVGHHRSAGYPAYMPAVFVYLHAGAHNAPVNKRYRLYAPWQGGIAAEIAVHYALVRFVLLA